MSAMERVVSFPAERSKGARGEGLCHSRPSAPREREGKGGRVIPGRALQRSARGRESRFSLLKSWIPFPPIANAILDGNDTPSL